MEIFSLLFGVDNLRKLAVMLGLTLIGLGGLYPLYKSMELKTMQIKFEQAKKIDSLEVKNLEKDVNKCELIINSNTPKLKKLKSLEDSLLKEKLTEDVKFRINLVNEEIKNRTTNDEALIKDLKTKYLKIEKTKINTVGLEKEIQNLNNFLNKYFLAQLFFVALGLFLFVTGMLKWNRSQKESDRLKDIEIKIKEEELIKIRKEISLL